MGMRLSSIAIALDSIYGGVADPLDTSTFFAPLTHSAILTRGTGNPTFTRATTAYVTDFEGLMKQTVSGEIRFSGARRVRNLLTATEAFASWTKQNGGTGSLAVITDNFGTAPDSTQTAARVYMDRGAGTTSSDYSRTFQVASVTGTGGPSAWIKSNTGSTQKLRFGAQIPGSLVVDVTTSWQRFSDIGVNPNYCSFLNAGDIAGGSQVVDVLIWHPQSENTSGQTNQNPSEYVSVGVASAPYHGAGVDGVKYFNTQNGNTVSSNVVTEATGALITSARAECAGGVTAKVVDATGPVGYLAEGARTNTALQSQTFGTTWVRTNIDVVTADQYVAPDGTTTMDKLTATAGSASHYIIQTLATTAATITQSVYVKYVNHRWCLLRIYDGTNIRGASFDLLNGVVGAVSASTTSKIEATAISGVYRISLTSTMLANASGQMVIAFQDADSATLTTWNAAGTEVIGVWGAQQEEGAFASTYIPTTTVAVTRNADVLAYPSAGNISWTVGSALVEATALVYAGGNPRLLGSGGGDPIIYMSTVTTCQSYDGTNAAIVNAGASFLTGVRKYGVSWGSGLKCFREGNAGTGTAFDGTFFAGATLAILPSISPTYGTTRNIRIWTSALTDAQLVSITT